MALSAAVVLSNPTIPYNRPSLAQVTISNSGGSPVTLKDLHPLVGAGTGLNSGVALGAWGPAIQPLVIPASGSAIATFPVVPFSPQVAGPSTEPLTYSIGCTLMTSDGSSFTATPATLTITPMVAN